MTATYTWDVFCSLDGFGTASANWTGYWGKQGPELLDHRLASYEVEQRMVFGATTYRAFVQMLASGAEEFAVWDALARQVLDERGLREGLGGACLGCSLRQVSHVVVESMDGATRTRSRCAIS